MLKWLLFLSCFFWKTTYKIICKVFECDSCFPETQRGSRALLPMICVSICPGTKAWRITWSSLETRPGQTGPVLLHPPFDTSRFHGWISGCPCLFLSFSYFCCHLHFHKRPTDNDPRAQRLPRQWIAAGRVSRQLALRGLRPFLQKQNEVCFEMDPFYKDDLQITSSSGS